MIATAYSLVQPTSSSSLRQPSREPGSSPAPALKLKFSHLNAICMPIFLSSSVHIHQVSASHRWPPELLHIITLFSQPLSPISNVDQNRLSLYASEVYEEVMARLPSFSISHDDCQDTSRKRIADILDTVFTTVHMLRSFTAATTRDYFPLRRTTTIWASLFNALALACSKDSVVMSDVPFLLPRTVVLDQDENATYDGLATLLISRYIALKDIQGNEMDTESGSLVMVSSSGSAECTLPRERHLHLESPFDGHILCGPGKRVDCVLPVVCVADQDNIRALVISTAYQRYTWGISVPVVGISVGNTGVIATVIIGWINDEDCKETSEVPFVHLASPTATVVDSSLGIFDLSDPVSALEFAQFILGLRGQFSDIVTNLGSHRRDICWRLDHSHAPDSEDPHMSISLDWRTRIQHWLYGIKRCDPCMDLIEPPEASQECSMHSPISDIKPPLPSISSKTSQSQASQSEETRNGYSPFKCSTEASAPGYYTASAFAALKDPLVSSASFGTQQSELDPATLSNPVPSRYSASAFAKLKDTLTDMRPGIEHWLWERCTLRAASIKMESFNTEVEAQINEIVDHYVYTLELAWPQQWPTTNCDADALCDPIVQGTLDSLIDKFNADSQSRTVSVPVLAKDEFTCLKNRLSIFLSAVSNVRHHLQQTPEGVVLAAPNMRGTFDLLLNLFWCENEADISNSYFQECKIRLATNKAVEGKLYDEDQAFLWGDIVRQQRSSLDRSAPLAIRRAVGARIALAGNKTVHCTRHPYPPELEIERRNEPGYGIADGLAVTRVSDTYDSVDTSKYRLSALNDQSSQLTYTDGPTRALLGKDSVNVQNHQELNEASVRGRTLQCQDIVHEPLTTPVHNCRTGSVMVESDITRTDIVKSIRYPTSNEVLLPRLVVKYQRANSSHPATAFRQCQMCCISAVEFLASIGIADCPVYGLVVSGSRVSIMMAWHSTKSIKLIMDPKFRGTDATGFNILIDENLVSLDIAEPLDAYRFVIAIHRIFLAGRRLADLLKGKDLGAIRELERLFLSQDI